MVTQILYIVSIVLQVFVAILAIRFISFTKLKFSWVLISFGFILMAFRRFIELSAFLNTKYYEELSMLSNWVGIATSVVIAIGVWLIRDIFYTLRIAEVERQRAERKVLTAIINTEEKERRRFAEDMHDGLGPMLSTIKLYVNELTSEDIPQAEKSDYVNYINQLIDDAVTDIRTMSDNLTPRVIHEYGLISAIEEFCKSISRTQKLSIRFKKPGKKPELRKHVEINLYRIVNELLNNTIKHAEAKSVDLSIAIKGKNLLFSYADDGKGFNYNLQKLRSKGEGINNIMTRVKSVNGSAKILSEQGKGFRIMIEIPVK
ncbi:MAG: sensor histidine kinase [Bacteroidales bacterium]|nr:sensor histidine kinase [Bacteroidales bacterium]